MPEVASILDSVKASLGVQDATAFDAQLIMHINGALSNLTQLGIGPEEGFRVSDNTKTWHDLLGDNEARYGAAKDYMFYSVRLAFDPPSLLSVLNAFKELRDEAAYRVNRAREDVVNPRQPKPGVEITDGSDLDASATKLEVARGFPFSKNVRISNGKNVWPTLDLVEAKMLIRKTKSTASDVLKDFTPYLHLDFDGNDLVVSWSLSGQETLDLVSGYYELVISDAGPQDTRAIRALYGYLNTSL